MVSFCQAETEDTQCPPATAHKVLDGAQKGIAKLLAAWKLLAKAVPLGSLR